MAREHAHTDLHAVAYAHACGQTGQSHKIEQMGLRVKSIEATLELMAEKLWDHESALEHEKVWQEKSRRA
jgi:hypothetical protein